MLLLFFFALWSLSFFSCSFSLPFFSFLFDVWVLVKRFGDETNCVRKNRSKSSSISLSSFLLLLLFNCLFFHFSLVSLLPSVSQVNKQESSILLFLSIFQDKKCIAIKKWKLSTRALLLSTFSSIFECEMTQRKQKAFIALIKSLFYAISCNYTSMAQSIFIAERSAWDSDELRSGFHLGSCIRLGVVTRRESAGMLERCSLSSSEWSYLEAPFCTPDRLGSIKLFQLMFNTNSSIQHKASRRGFLDYYVAWRAFPQGRIPCINRIGFIECR